VNSERAPLAVPQWNEFASGVERFVFPGGHATIFQSPAIAVLAAQVKACLEKAQKASIAASWSGLRRAI
jgi:thioesterase domain-containing protein